ncbi:drug/metabolite transporter (DMT)-like permease [Catenulispora sp. EB89]|uniref:DMT family transporter n=1 Tax=Catenulispora sp. EB89 TaxID=3156257 RepID=UPI003519B36E
MRQTYEKLADVNTEVPASVPGSVPASESTLSVSPAPGSASSPLSPAHQYAATRRSGLLATAGLVATTAVWGSTFLVVKDTIASVPVLDFLALRFAVACAAMLAVRPRALAGLGRAGWRHGVLLGLVLAAGYAAQTFGLRTASASVSGFITGLFVVFTPLIGAVLLRRRVPPAVWAAVALATVGLGLISLHGLSIGRGELLTVVGAFFFALHIVGLGEWSHRHDAYALAVVQIGTVAAVSLLLAVISHGSTGGHVLTLPPNAAGWAAVAVTALLGTAAGFFLQTWSQARMPATRAAVVLTMEPVFAGVTGVLAGETLAVRGWIGAALVLAAMYAVELGPRRR